MTNFICPRCEYAMQDAHPDDAIAHWLQEHEAPLREALRAIISIAFEGETDHSFRRPAGVFFREIVRVAQGALGMARRK